MFKPKLDLKFLRRKPAEIFGLDVGSSAIKAVQVLEADGEYRLGAVGIVTLPPDTIAEGSIKDPATVGGAIKEAVQKAGLTTTNAVISICGRELIIKKVQIPAMPAKELAGAVHLEAEHHIPFAIDEVFIDFHPVAESGGTLDLILVAVKKSKVMEYITVVEDAGLNALIVDVDSFALSNQFELNAPASSEEAVALIDIGASIMKTNVIRAGASIFARDIPFGGNQYTQAIAQRLGVPFEQAEAAKLGRDPNVEWESLLPAIEEVSHELSLEVQRTFDYFASTAESERIGKIVLSGGCCQVPGLNEYLASNWGIPVELAQPFGRIAVPDEHAETVTAAGPSLAVAVGLGLRRPGDKAS
jgi:type IV pilus assembly protein PilM